MTTLDDTITGTQQGLPGLIDEVVLDVRPAPSRGSIPPETQRLLFLGMMVAETAHDLKNLVTPIKAYAALINRYLAKGEYQKAETSVRRILTICDSSVDYLQDLVDYSRDETRSLVPTNVNEVVQKALEIFEVHDNYGIVRGLSARGAVNGDPTRLLRYVQNMLTNAKDAMPDGGIVMVTTEDIETPGFDGLLEYVPRGKYTVISVSDTGSGIRPEVLPRILEPFFTTKTNRIGHGLGLALSYKILKAHDGYIDIATTVGKGTTFTGYLPTLEA